MSNKDYSETIAAECAVVAGSLIPWGAHAAFRLVIDKTKLKKLIRNSDKTYVFVTGLDMFVIAQKTDLIASLQYIGAEEDIAATFNGTNLCILGVIGTRNKAP